MKRFKNSLGSHLLQRPIYQDRLKRSFENVAMAKTERDRTVAATQFVFWWQLLSGKNMYRACSKVNKNG